MALTNPLWEKIRERQQVFSGVFAWASDTFNIAPSGEGHDVGGLWVSGDFFRVLGVAPAMGRLFTAADDRRGLRVGSRRGDQLRVLAARIGRRSVGDREEDSARPRTAGGDRRDAAGVFRIGGRANVRHRAADMRGERAEGRRYPARFRNHLVANGNGSIEARSVAGAGFGAFWRGFGGDLQSDAAAGLSASRA